MWTLLPIFALPSIHGSGKVPNLLQSQYITLLVKMLLF